MICYNYKSEKFNFWATISLIGRHKMFGWKPAHWEECKKDESCYKNGYYNSEVYLCLLPDIAIGDGRAAKNYYFRFYWLIFGFGFDF